MAEYEACILGLNLAVDMNIQELLVIGDSDLLNQNESADALATMSSMIQHSDKNFINPIPVRIHNQPAYCAYVEEEADGNPWFHDIKEYLAKREYPEHANHTQKCTLRRLSNHFFQSGGIMYRRTPDLGLLRCVNAKEASKLIEEIHSGTCGPHMNGFVLAKKILRSGYFWMTMETNCIRYVQKCHQCQIHASMIQPAASNGHRFILVAIDYFTKWVEAASYKAVTKKVIADFVRDRIVCRLGVPESNITNNAANLNSDLMKSMSLYEQLALIDGKRMNAVCHGQLYQNRMSKAFNKRVKPRQFAPGQLVLKRIFPHQDEAKGKFSPNWQGPYMVHRVPTGGALILAEMDGENWPEPINSDAVKRYYVYTFLHFFI
ncbi:uncharacterized protein [Nicotiana tomentosiformis]|uniref:uncharacterized protein n=1 Tax=Nicotiana tomentosiformis TaxID=4098 RepID=UPI00388C5826